MVRHDVNIAALVEQAKDLVKDQAFVTDMEFSPRTTVEIAIDGVIDNFIDTVDEGGAQLHRDVSLEFNREQQAFDDHQEASNPMVLAEVLKMCAESRIEDPDSVLDFAVHRVREELETFVTSAPKVWYTDVFDIDREGSDLVVTIDKWKFRWAFVGIENTTEPPITADITEEPDKEPQSPLERMWGEGEVVEEETDSQVRQDISGRLGIQIPEAHDPTDPPFGEEQPIIDRTERYDDDDGDPTRYDEEDPMYRNDDMAWLN